MVNIRKRTIGKEKYFYLEHTFKVGKKVKKKEQYLGKTIPKDIETIKKKFLHEIYQKKWFDKIDKIQKQFSKEYNSMPKIAKEKYMQNFLVKFTYESNKIEGSTITLKETARLLERGITPQNKPLKDIKETETHKKVFLHMIDYKKDLDFNIVLHWHRTLFKETEADIAGIIRKHGVEVAQSKTVFPIPAELNTLLREFFAWYKKNKKKYHPAELAALVHLKFVSVHPFSDGNGRISRILMNFILHKNNFPMLNIYYANRDRYYTALERAQVKKEEHIFVQYFLKRYMKEHIKYLK